LSIFEAVERVRGFPHLLAFGAKKTVDMKIVSVNDIIRDMESY
jgi:hypothetical protein